jgi:serine/threonine protein kinase
VYIAPEVLKRKAGQNHSKADMYSLGVGRPDRLCLSDADDRLVLQIVFFEMNMPPFATGTERYHVIMALRTPKVNLPSNWPPGRSNQAQVIKLLLQHNPALRPTAAELSRNSLLPKRMEEESIHEALRLLGESGLEGGILLIDLT